MWPSKKEMRQAKSFLHENQNLDATTLVDIAWAQGVAPQVYHNILCLKEQSQHLTFLNQFFLQAQQDLEERKKYIMRLFADLELFHAEVSAIGGRFMVIKGACFQNLYPAESFRQMGDIDLVISQDTVWKGIDAFKRIRHRPKRIRLEKYPYSAQSSDGIFGIAEMLDLDGDPRALPFDLHLGAFPGCGDSILESNMWDRAIPLRVGHREVLVASLEDCILIICSHISRHGYAKLRDLNDTHVVLRHAGNNFDWDYLYQFARKNSLQTILYGLLLRLQRDYEVELPTEVISKLKPDGLDILTSKFLFKPGRENLNFHGGRRLFLGRFLQTAFLYRYYLERAGFLTATKESLSGLYFLFQSGRPYRLWRQRHIQSFSSNRRIVIIPIEATTHKECWQIEQILLPKVQKFAAKSGIAIEWVGNQVIIWNVGHPNELLLTPEGIYAQSPYDGHLCNNTLEKIQRIAWEVVSQLSEVGAILGKLVAL
ncbi:MAG: nucleotidyltransferase family protein [Candidatus Poribacteria bacterium]|nr:nucleotidyltransferase family protein [Candidatus Poribacteria bacterium]